MAKLPLPELGWLTLPETLDRVETRVDATRPEIERSLKSAFRDEIIDTRGNNDTDLYACTRQRCFFGYIWDQAEIDWETNQFRVPRSGDRFHIFTDIEVCRRDLEKWLNSADEEPESLDSILGHAPDYRIITKRGADRLWRLSYAICLLLGKPLINVLLINDLSDWSKAEKNKFEEVKGSAIGDIKDNILPGEHDTDGYWVRLTNFAEWAPSAGFQVPPRMAEAVRQSAPMATSESMHDVKSQDVDEVESAGESLLTRDMQIQREADKIWHKNETHTKSDVAAAIAASGKFLDGRTNDPTPLSAERLEKIIRRPNKSKRP